MGTGKETKLSFHPCLILYFLLCFFKSKHIRGFKLHVYGKRQIEIENFSK